MNTIAIMKIVILLFDNYTALDEISQADIVLIPGGNGIDSLLNNKEILDWLQRMDSTTKWTTSVCSGSLLLAQAGLLKGNDCTTCDRV
jgi:putative intracellular protease/amidase